MVSTEEVEAKRAEVSEKSLELVDARRRAATGSQQRQNEVDMAALVEEERRIDAELADLAPAEVVPVKSADELAAEAAAADKAAADATAAAEAAAAEKAAADAAAAAAAVSPQNPQGA